MEIFLYWFGEDENLNIRQMALRALVVCAYCLALLRVSGRRALAFGTPIDNVNAILLGATLSRAVTGASPFFPTLAAGATITLVHRSVTYVSNRNRKIGRLLKGSPKVVYENGSFNEKNMKYCRMSVEDVMEGMRSASGLEDLDKVKTIFVERSGDISVIRKEEA